MEWPYYLRCHLGRPWGCILKNLPFWISVNCLYGGFLKLVVFVLAYIMSNCLEIKVLNTWGLGSCCIFFHVISVFFFGYNIFYLTQRWAFKIIFTQKKQGLTYLFEALLWTFLLSQSYIRWINMKTYSPASFPSL